MAAWLGWAARERRMRTRGRRQLEHCPLLPTCCRCVSGIAHCPIKVPPAHTLIVKCTQRATSLVWGYVSRARGFGFASYAFDLLVLSLCFPLSFSVPLQTRSTPSCWSLLWKIERKKREGDAQRGHEKNPRAMWLDQQTDWDIELTNQSVNNAHPIEKTKQKKKHQPAYCPTCSY